MQRRQVCRFLVLGLLLLAGSGGDLLRQLGRVRGRALWAVRYDPIVVELNEAGEAEGVVLKSEGELCEVEGTTT